MDSSWIARWFQSEWDIRMQDAGNPFEGLAPKFRQVLLPQQAEGTYVRLVLAVAVSILCLVGLIFYMLLVVRDARKKKHNPWWILKRLPKAGQGTYIVTNAKTTFALFGFICVLGNLIYLVSMIKSYSIGPTGLLIFMYGFVMISGIVSTWVWLFGVFQAFVLFSEGGGWVCKIKASVSNWIFIVGTFVTLAAGGVTTIFSWMKQIKMMEAEKALSSAIDGAEEAYNLNPNISLEELQARLTDLQIQFMESVSQTYWSVAVLFITFIPFAFLYLLIAIVCLYLVYKFKNRVRRACSDLLRDLPTPRRCMYQIEAPNTSSERLKESFSTKSRVFNHEELLTLLKENANQPHVVAQIHKIIKLQQTFIELATFCWVEIAVNMAYTCTFVVNSITFLRHVDTTHPLTGIFYELGLGLGTYVTVGTILPGTLFLIFVILIKDARLASLLNSSNAKSEESSGWIASGPIHLVHLDEQTKKGEEEEEKIPQDGDSSSTINDASHRVYFTKTTTVYDDNRNV